MTREIHTTVRYSKEVLRKHIEAYKAIIFDSISFSRARIAVHMNKDDRDDYPRMVFALSGLLYAESVGAISLTREEKEKLIELFWSIYAKAKDVCDEKEKLYVILYGIQLLSYAKVEHDVLVEDFKQMPYAELFTYPVMTYCFMTSYAKSEILRSFTYAEELFLQAKKVFDFYLYSNKNERMLPFHFAELSHQKEYVDERLLKQAHSIITSKLSGYFKGEASASGAAKCMEHFARVDDKEGFHLCETFLQQERSIDRFSLYMDPKYEKQKEYLFTEESSSQYVCLDTSVHLLIAYSTLYAE